MKNILIAIVLVVSTTVACAQKSPREKATGTIDNAKVEVDYGAPGVKGRVIWGELVPFDKVWRAGANENTTVTFDKDVTLAGKPLAAGKYGFFIIPNEKGDWIVIFSKKNDAWGSNGYSESNDALRVNIKPEMVGTLQEQLEFKVGKTGIDFAWEKARLNIPVKGK
ncbi:MAG: DUF2911 domain-containing protein [Flavobacteriaceae bacterium]|nr:DUF2911 domain-containing protein [Flavobacteriaceae bacterium]